MDLIAPRSATCYHVQYKVGFSRESLAEKRLKKCQHILQDRKTVEH